MPNTDKTGFVNIPQHSRPPGGCDRLKTDEGCYWCCDRCNYVDHTCPGCATPLTHLGNELVEGKPHKCWDD